ncbi:MAG: GNAT family N-acetyltransferase [Burkholderiaceae bacterium]|nr:GNAT family N-acetyltransferase [Burkholderiaceae bacterium]MCD8518067.1 GNAT family N-acetyltransferase [Burkholderiaceae bacterium]MCD8565132.1 GNAT family N-acetyltransferase [Burkholderiaceae bacterium]
MNTTDKALYLEFGPWTELKPLALPVRLAVFVQEQGVPIELEQDEYDQQAVHVVAFVPPRVVVGTGRLIVMDKALGKIGRLAVKKSYRGKGHGKIMMQALIERAQSLGLRELKLHAQCDAESFYQSLGFVTQGDRFMEAGIEHVLMVKRLIA